MIKTIFHAHNWSFARIRSDLTKLADCGYDAVQISPAQKSPPGDAWYLRYQPYDHLVIEGLGSERELKALSADAKRLGITIIADVVFNHMAILPGLTRNDWLTAKDRDALRAKLDEFPHLTRDDFAPWRDMQGPDWDNEHRYESWGNGEWAELLPTPNVLRIHQQHMQILYDAGVRGFRFDAVKHMRPNHLQHYVDAIKSFPQSCYVYGEVFSDNEAMHREYAHLFPTTDFPFITKLKARLAKTTPDKVDATNLFMNNHSVRFGMNHDLACNPSHLVEGLLFQTPEQTRFANHLCLKTPGGTVLVYAVDHEHDAELRRLVRARRSLPEF